MRLNRNVIHSLYICIYMYVYIYVAQCQTEQNALQVQGVRCTHYIGWKNRHHFGEWLEGVGGIDACGWVGATDKHMVPDSEGSSSKDCHQWPCWSHLRPAAEPQCWQLSRGSAGRGSLRHPYWLTRQMMRVGWWQCCSLSWRKSELWRRRMRRRREKKRNRRGPPASPHPPWRKTWGGSMRRMKKGLDGVEALMAVGEGAPMVAAVLGGKQWWRHSLHSCL